MSVTVQQSTNYGQPAISSHTVAVQGATYGVPAPPSNTDEYYHHGQSFVLGIIQLCCGIVCIIFNIVGVTDAVGVNRYIYMAAPGIWCSGLFLLAGTFSVVAGRTKRVSFISASLAFNIIANILAVVLFVWGCVGLASSNYVQGIEEVLYGTSDDVYKEYQMSMAVSGTFAITGSIVFVITTWLYVLGCMSCCRSPPVSQAVTVVQTSTSTQPMMSLGSQQFAQQFPQQFAQPQMMPYSQPAYPPPYEGPARIHTHAVPPFTKGVPYQQLA